MYWEPDYGNSLLSVANAVLAHYGAAAHHGTLPALDALLAKGYKNVVLLVMDGMGVNVLERNLPPTSFLRRHLFGELSSVFPCTTTAATTALLTGKSPAEHGWIGWSCYFSEVDRCIDLFSNNESGTNRQASGEHLPEKLLGYQTILSAITEATAGGVQTHSVSPFSGCLADTMEDICHQLALLCATPSRKFINAYHHQPDHDMHDFGVSPPCVQAMLADYDRQLTELAASLSDTLLLITADHGMADITMLRVEDYPQLQSMLVRHICMEPRCCSFYVKESCRVDFPALFVDLFGDKFRLYTHDEFLCSGLLGPGTPHPKVADFVGDYLAVAVAELALWYDNCNGEFKDFKGAHAGLTKDELVVPLIVIEKP